MNESSINEVIDHNKFVDQEMSLANQAVLNLDDSFYPKLPS